MYGGMKRNKLRKKQGGFMDKAETWQRGDEAVRNLPSTISKGMSSMASKARSFFGFKKGGFPDLSGDGKITRKDILMGRGVIGKGKKKKQTGGPSKFGPKSDRIEKRRQRVEKRIFNAKPGSKREDRLYDREGKLMDKSGKASKKYKAKQKAVKGKKMMGGKKNMYQTGGFLEPGIENRQS